MGAYLLGVMFGRSKVIRKDISQKSWGRFFRAGLALAVGVGVRHQLFRPGGGTLRPYRFVWTGLSVVAVISGVLGDLVESLAQALRS